MEIKEAKELCVRHVYRYVRITMVDGSMHDGFVEKVDDERVYLAVPIGHENMPYHHMGHGGTAGHHYDRYWDTYEGYPAYDTRAFFPGFFPYAPYGFGYGYGFPYGRRFNRLILPLAGLTALTLLPFF